MPNRIIRDGILSSESISLLDWAGEVFFRRLMSVVDDYGRFYASPKLLRAACYPLQIDQVSDSDIEKWLAECATATLIKIYPAKDGKIYLEVQRFNQQIRSNASKFPSPPQGLENSPHPNESDIEVLVEAHIQKTKSFCGLEVLSVRRQVRVGDSYIDLLLDTTAGRCVVELKRGNLTDKNLGQICRYVAEIPGSFGVLVGAAISPRMNRVDAMESDVALCEFTENLQFSIVVPSSKVKACDFTVNHGKSMAHLDVDVDVDVFEGVSEDVSVSENKAPIKKVETKPKSKPSASPPLPDWLDSQIFEKFRDHRIALKSRMTPHAEELIVKEIGKFRERGYDPTALIEQSISNGWKGIFELKGVAQNGTRSSVDDQRAAVRNAMYGTRPVERTINGEAVRLD